MKYFWKGGMPYNEYDVNKGVWEMPKVIKIIAH